MLLQLVSFINFVAKVFFLLFTVRVADIRLVASHDDIDKDQSMTLTCITNYCNPRATIIWYKGSQRITSGITNNYTLDSNSLEMTTSILVYVGLVEDNGLQVHCTASNIPNNTVVSPNTMLDVKCKLNMLFIMFL